MTFARTYPVWRKFAVDSPLEEAVRSEPVSEMGFSGTGELGSDSKPFMGGAGSVRAPFRARILEL